MSPIPPLEYAPRRGDEPPPGLHDVPVLLIEFGDESARWRMLAIALLSVLLHIAFLAALPVFFRLMPERAYVALSAPMDMFQGKDLTFLALPPDAQKIERPPETNIISDKNRIATSRAPTLDKKTLDELVDAARPGPPGLSAPPPQPGSQAAASSGAGSPAPPQSGPANQMAELQPPPFSHRGGFGGSMSAGSAIQEAARAAAANRGGIGGMDGDYGLGSSPRSNIRSGFDVLSDTMGVDFGPYLARVVHDVRTNWYTIIPEVARAPLMKRGRVVIQFAILKDGSVAGLKLNSTSGDVALDRAAWGGITASNPFQPLPPEFRGQYLALRFYFFYNQDPEKEGLR
ncbi:MAG: TonB family protein [Terriglobales bacterium]